jgi:protein-tyrosine phosphatase
VISLTDLMVNESAAFHELGILHVCVPLPTSAPPKPGDKENVRELLPAACEVIERRMLRDGGAVLVHCGAGKDRTGLVLCYALMRVLGLTMTEAMARLKARRPDLLSAAGWWDMATQVLGEVPVFR